MSSVGHFFFRCASLLVASAILSAGGVIGEEHVHFPDNRFMTASDEALAKEMADRESDWRNGAVIYQVLVDRFAPAPDLAAKAQLYQPPKTLRAWEDEPAQGSPSEGTAFWTHELDFWGGDLASLTARLDYIEELGVDVVYLNPIHEAFTNHKYDAMDYSRVSPEYGSREDVSALAAAIHERGMRLVLDGVFNHMGIYAPVFIDARSNPESTYREWFSFGDHYRDGYRSWADSATLPELVLENPDVRTFIYGDKDSVVQSYLRDGVDGWRLDVAFDIGPIYLRELKEAAHSVNPESVVIGEIWSYPDGWIGSVDGVMSYTLRQIILGILEGSISGPVAGVMIDKMVEDTGIEPMLKSWTIIDNHDTPRLRTLLPQAWQQNMAQTLQVTLPGSPNFYYGVEIGMEGGEDPANRGPMRWEHVTPENPYLKWTKDLILLRRNNRALRIGNYRPIISERLLAFERYTDKVLEAVLVFANPSSEAVRDTVMIRNHKLMNGTKLMDAFSGEVVGEIRSSVLTLEVPAQTVLVLKPVDFGMDWSPYGRIH